MNKKVRVRFAPSPTGGLHLGGVRTALFNYLFAKQHQGSFIIRIEDTDKTRFVDGAEKYIYNTLEWCGIKPDESPLIGGAFAPYKQSERKSLYKQYAEQLVKNGYAYYAFDTPEALEQKRKSVANFQYNQHTRMSMQNSLVLGAAETEKLLANNIPHVIRIKMPENEEITFTDMIRGEVFFNASLVDDKVLLKADAMPTYHLAVVVDDYLMQISHSFRGEEWLPSAPVHILLWKYLFGLENMPQWAHLPLILKPDGNGKLSKRDGDRLGFPVFAMDWKDPKTNEITIGFKERGFLPEAFVNMLAMLGWNDGTEQEIFSLHELIEKFSIERIHKAGAKFDYEKAKWYNHEWIKKLEVGDVRLKVKELLGDIANNYDDTFIDKVITLVKDRCTLLTDFVQQTSFFFKSPETIAIDVIQPKWNEQKKVFFTELIQQFESATIWNVTELENIFKETASSNQLKPGEVMLPLRIMLVGDKFGAGVFDIAALIGKNATISRIEYVLSII
ncbi:MAG: glutamate--tRNA ligase [Chitinophagaceae bacterium]|nr:glutamate--tRNA ligase [Chitinophagaceae bacterium]MCW5905371.1 glutamate--tRNA ligase [Chitinophagaceae bacterium]